MWDPYSTTRDETHRPYNGRQNPNHWAIGEVPVFAPPSFLAELTSIHYLSEAWNGRQEEWMAEEENSSNSDLAKHSFQFSWLHFLRHAEELQWERRHSFKVDFDLIFCPGSGRTSGNSSFVMEALTSTVEWGRGSYPGVRCAVYKYLPPHPEEDHPFLPTWQSGWVTWPSVTSDKWLEMRRH